MTDRFSDHTAGFDAPASSAFPITPNTSADLAEVTRAVYVGGGGTLVVEMVSGDVVTFAAVPSGSILPLRVRKVHATTTASQLVGLS